MTQSLAQICAGEQMTIVTQAVAAIVPVTQVATAVMDRSEESVGTEVESPSVSSPLTDEYLLPLLDAEVLSYFAPEAQEYLESLEAQLLRLEKEPHNSDVIDQLFRTAHTLKGSAYTVGFQSLGDLMHYVEDFMGAVREGRVKILPGHTDVLLRSVDVVRLLMRRDPTSLDMLRQRFAVRDWKDSNIWISRRQLRSWSLAQVFIASMRRWTKKSREQETSSLPKQRKVKRRMEKSQKIAKSSVSAAIGWSGC